MPEISDEALDRLTRSMDKLVDKMNDMGSSMGRGTTSQVPGRNKDKDAGGSLPNKELEEMQKRLKQLTDKLTVTRNLTAEEIKEREELIKKTETLTNKTGKAADSYKDLEKGLKGFGKGLLTGQGTLVQAFDGLSSSLSHSSSKIGNILGGFAGGVSFMLTALTEFAADARQLGGFADLGAFRIGSIKQAKLMSGLGDSFIKAIELSQGGFKAFGRNSQESVEALSELSRGFRVGSGAISSTLAKNLGPELTKTMDRAQQATAAMGLSQEDQAAVMGSLSQTISLTAKSEKEAQQMMVKQYEETVQSARTLSNTFGVSAKEILKAMEAFRKTSGGQTTALLGLDQEGANIAGLIDQMGVKVDDETRGRMAAAIAQGDFGTARALVKPEDQETFNAVERAIRSAQGREGGLANAQNLQAGAREQIGALEAQFEQRRRAQFDAEFSGAGQRAGSAAARMRLQQRAEAGDRDAQRQLAAQGTTTESAGITAQNKLTDALNSLRNTIIGLTAGVFALVGILPAVLGAGGIGAILSGGLGGKLLGGIGEKLGGVLGKIPGVGGIGEKMGGALGKIPGFGGGAAGAAGGAAKAGGSAVMDKMAGAVGSGLSSFGEMLGKLGDNKTVKGAGTIALLGAALALAAHGFATFEKVGIQGLLVGTVALGGLIAMARLVGEASTAMVKGAAAIAILGGALLVSAIGFKTFNDVKPESLISGALALGILAGTAKLIGNMGPKLLIGAAAIAALGAAMFIAGKGFAAFNEVSLEGIGTAAASLLIFGVAAAVMGKFLPLMLLGSVAIAALGASLAVFSLGAMVAAKAAQMFSAAIVTLGSVDGGNLIKVGAGLAAIGVGMGVFALGMLAGTASGVVSGIASLFGVKSPLDKVKEFVPMADKIAMVGEGIKNFGEGILAINKGVAEFDKDAFSALKTSMEEFAIAGSSEEMRLTAEYLKTIGEGLSSISQIQELPSVGSLAGDLSNSPTLAAANSAAVPGNTESAMSLETVTAMMGYLSNIQSDIAAIRGNTKPSPSDAPVRMS